ncbi:alpha/beta hydrolase [Uliginosibacterium flavum]|uniref:Alpha/beta hydrolase n=1 Tax=Uliginosibacterium flavum TaxID=1396831 RepID=A0ABV2TJQ5_9RHOO
MKTLHSSRPVRFAGFALSALLVLYTGLCSAASFKGQAEFPLWGDQAAPATNGVKLEEKWTDVSSNKPFEQEPEVAGISTPTLSVFVPRSPNGAAMIVIPGGGYSKLCFGKEGVEIARWLNSLGITAFVLKHRLPVEWPTGVGRHMPLQDGQRAVRLLRAHAADWNLDPQRIGVMGFSAGGHLAALLGTAWKQKSYEARDAIDALSARPDVIVVAYGVFDFAGRTLPAKASEGALAIHDYPAVPAADSSPAFIVAADDDPKVNTEQSARFYAALHNAKVPAELHIYRGGDHGFALRKNNALPVADWARQSLEWMRASGFVPR